MTTATTGDARPVEDVPDLPDLPPIPTRTGVAPRGHHPADWASYSAIMTHRRCPQQWAYKYLRELAPTEDMAAERDFGTWWHALLAARNLARGRALDSLRYTPKAVKADTATAPGREFVTDTVTPEEVLEGAAAWWLTLPAATRDEWVERMGAPLPDRLPTLYDRWRGQWADDLQHEAPLAVEMGFGRQLGGRVTVPGYIDLVYVDQRRGFAAILDYKSHKNLPAASTTADLLESQLPLYAWAVSERVAEWGHEVRVLGYDRARSMEPKLPKLTVSGGLSKSVTDYDLDTYLGWVGDGVEWGTEGEYVKTGKNAGAAKFGTYTVEESVIARLKDPATTSAWFQRARLPMSRQAVLTHVRSAALTQQQMRMTSEHFDKYGDAPRNFGKACTWCDYRSLCAAELTGGPAGDYPLEDHRLKHAPRYP